MFVSPIQSLYHSSIACRRLSGSGSELMRTGPRLLHSIDGALYSGARINWKRSPIDGSSAYDAARARKSVRLIVSEFSVDTRSITVAVPASKSNVTLYTPKENAAQPVVRPATPPRSRGRLNAFKTAHNAPVRHTLPRASRDRLNPLGLPVPPRPRSV